MLHVRADVVLTCTQDVCTLADTILTLSANIRNNVFSLDKPLYLLENSNQRGYAAIKWIAILHTAEFYMSSRSNR